MWGIAEPNIFINVAGLRVFNGNGSPVNLDSEISDLTISCKSWRLQTNKPMQDSINLGREERLVHNGGGAEFDRRTLTRRVVLARYHNNFC